MKTLNSIFNFFQPNRLTKKEMGGEKIGEAPGKKPGKSPRDGRAKIESEPQFDADEKADEVLANKKAVEDFFSTRKTYGDSPKNKWRTWTREFVRNVRSVSLIASAARNSAFARASAENRILVIPHTLPTSHALWQRTQSRSTT